VSYPISGKKASLSSGRPGVVNPHEDDGPQKVVLGCIRRSESSLQGIRLLLLDVQSDPHPLTQLHSNYKPTELAPHPTLSIKTLLQCSANSSSPSSRPRSLLLRRSTTLSSRNE